MMKVIKISSFINRSDELASGVEYRAMAALYFVRFVHGFAFIVCFTELAVESFEISGIKTSHEFVTIEFVDSNVSILAQLCRH